MLYLLTENRNFSEKQRDELREKGFTVRTREEGFRNKFEIPEKLIDGKENLNQDELLEGIDCPILFIHGTEDETVPINQSKKAAKKLENTELKKIEDDHYWKESVSEVADASSEFFKRHLN